MAVIRTDVSLSGEDFSIDLVRAWEQSFKISFAEGDFAKATTIGDVLAVVRWRVEQHGPLVESSLCSTQQLFYRLRRALVATGLPRQAVTPQLRLTEVMPLRQRRRQWLLLQQNSGIPLPNLVMHLTWYIATWGIVAAGVRPLTPGWGYAVFTGLAAALLIREYSFVQLDLPVTTLGDLAFHLFVRSYYQTTGGRMAWPEVRSIVLAGLAECSNEEADVAAAELNEQTRLSF